MNYDYYQQTACEYDEFLSKGLCAANPNVSALQETLILFLKELAHYLLELKKFGAHNELIKEQIIEAISGIITNVDYNSEQFKTIVIELAQDLAQARTLYAQLCEQNKCQSAYIKSSFNNLNNLIINDIIKKGEKYYIKRNTEYTFEQKNLFDIAIILIKRLCFKIIQIRTYHKNYDAAYTSILELLDTLNCEHLTPQEIKSKIEKSNQVYYDLQTELYKSQEETHGKRESVYIAFAPRNGKAILVSGIDMNQLETVLKATKNRGIDVYTHGMTMLMAHTLSRFREYPHLVGHFGKGSESSLFDFAAFPGAILMTRYLFQKVEYLYRGRLFTTDSFAPRGVSKIKDNNYEPLIQAALQAKGFTKQEQEVILRVGFRQKEMEEKVQDVLNKMRKNEIKHLYFIGILHNESEYKEYFDKFLKLMPKDCYAVSLSHERNEENVLHVDSFYDYLFIYKIFEKFKEIYPLDQLKITIFITKCDQYTITNIINFLNMGIKDIYLCKCIPTLINPSMVETMRKVFGIKAFTTPKEDLEATLKD